MAIVYICLELPARRIVGVIVDFRIGLDMWILIIAGLVERWCRSCKVGIENWKLIVSKSVVILFE